jgi:cytoskeletal protein RodZ
MERTGDRLKKIRLEKGLSLEEVHKRTKIHINVLRAIEDDSFVNLNPVYVKGFLKIYCQFLGENPADYINDYREPRQRVVVTDEQPSQVRAVQSPPRRPDGAPVLKAVRSIKMPVLNPVLLKLVGVAGAGIVAVVVLVFLVRLAGAGISAISAKRKPANPPAAAVARKKEAPKPKPQEPAPVQLPAQSEAPEHARAQQALPKALGVEAGGVIRLGIRAKEDCWLQVRVDGKTVFQSVLNRGRLEGWQAANKIELTLGDAGKVDLEINGSRIPALGRKGQPVKNILITREGLKVGK